ncbi:hypothetical protein MNBD_BACTEROID01-2945 [hydrothermal vent metagenome]|uniref:Acetyl xylan esterase domain-containing protein n=1 Tax=hydrothermal vent metagenome TaxID=652676 RepID=A0A3B0UG85_9ZZZZ
MKSIKIYLQAILVFFSLEVILISPLVAQEENLNVLEDWVEWSNGKNMLPLHLGKQAYKLLDHREQEISLLKNENDWLARQKKVKGLLMDAVGPLPEKSPLNPKVTGVIYRDGYRVEKIIYESLPGFYVTSCLFIPEGVKGKRPAILYASGHSDIAFRNETYQHIIINLVKKGFIVFATDPFGQGERMQYYDPETKASSIGNSSSEHTYVGNQCLISGVTTARYSVWDCIRAIDYLCTRKEVDTKRIGMTGRSGGGMQTAYVCAFDERLAAAAPECYITSFRRLFESIMPQDAEQNFFHGIAYGIDHADLLEVRAPKPTLIIATTRDFFSIQGTRETYSEVKKAYKAFGVGDNLRMTEDDNVHKSTKKNREAMYAFFQETLGLPGSYTDEDVEIMDEKELFVTPTGQLANSFGGETVFSINKKETKKLIEKLEASREGNGKHIPQVVQKAKELSGYKVPERHSELVFRGRYQRDGYSVELYALRGEGDYVIPVLLMIPKGGTSFPALVYLGPEGKDSIAAPNGKAEELVRQGFMVAVPDMIGTGETKWERYPPRAQGYPAQLIGRSIVGIHASDITRLVNMLKERNDVKKDRIGTIAYGELCPALLHAAAFDSSLNRVALVNPPISYRDIVENKMYKYGFSFLWGVAGALTAYDLPDLAAAIAPGKLLMLDIVDYSKNPAPKGLIEKEYKITKSAYSKDNALNNFKVARSDTENLSELLGDWLFR